MELVTALLTVSKRLQMYGKAPLPGLETVDQSVSQASLLSRLPVVCVPDEAVPQTSLLSQALRYLCQYLDAFSMKSPQPAYIH